MFATSILLFESSVANADTTTTTNISDSLNKRFGAVAFGNFGDVGHNITDFSFNDLKYTYGAGIRYAINKSERLNLRVDYGIGPGNNRGFYFQLGEAF
jgi:hypothetical protein